MDTENHVAPPSDCNQMLSPEERNAEMQIKRASNWNQPNAIQARQAQEQAAKEKAEIDAKDQKQGARGGAMYQSLFAAVGGTAAGKDLAQKLWHDNVAEPIAKLDYKPDASLSLRGVVLLAIARILDKAEAELPGWIGQVEAARDHETQAKRAARAAAQEADANRSAKGMSPTEALDWLENGRRLGVRLNKKNQIECTPIRRVGMPERAMIRLHREGLVELLAEREQWGVVE